MTKPFEPIPPSQLFRALLLHMLDTHRTLAPIVRSSTSVPLKLCHQQNTYILSEIESWLEAQREELDLSPAFSSAQCAELQAGVESCLRASESPGESSSQTASDARTDLPRTTQRVASSRRSVSTQRVWVRNSTGQIIFQAPSSSVKPASTSPIHTSASSEHPPLQ